MSVIIYHNPRCSKSRNTLTLLKENGVDPLVVEYLKTPLDRAALKDLIAKLGIDSARDLMRSGEAVYKDLALKTETDEAALIQAMADHPILMERPVVVHGDKAQIGRPPESVLEIL